MLDFTKPTDPRRLTTLPIQRSFVTLNLFPRRLRLLYAVIENQQKTKRSKSKFSPSVCRVLAVADFASVLTSPSVTLATVFTPKHHGDDHAASGVAASRCITGAADVQSVTGASTEEHAVSCWRQPQKRGFLSARALSAPVESRSGDTDHQTRPWWSLHTCKALGAAHSCIFQPTTLAVSSAGCARHHP